MSKEQLTVEEKIVLNFIKEFHAKNEWVRVVDLIKLIEKGAGLGRRQVIEAITGLERKGFIRLTDRHDMGVKEGGKEAEYPKEIVELKARIKRLKDLIIKMT